MATRRKTPQFHGRRSGLRSQKVETMAAAAGATGPEEEAWATEDEDGLQEDPNLRGGASAGVSSGRPEAELLSMMRIFSGRPAEAGAKHACRAERTKDSVAAASHIKEGAITAWRPPISAGSNRITNHIGCSKPSDQPADTDTSHKAIPAEPDFHWGQCV